jgi:hypothetical protein
LRGIAKTNLNGGIYHPGRRYELPKKMEVGVAFLELNEEKNDVHRVTVKYVVEVFHLSLSIPILVLFLSAHL